MQKIVQVHMLPTDNLSNLCVVDYHNGKKDMLGAHNHDAFKKESSSDVSISPQHLYFTSEEEIKEGDWYYHVLDKEISKSICNWAKLGDDEELKARKIVATTNPELWSYDYTNKKSGQPPSIISPAKIPLSFVKEYVEKQGNIKEVKLEYWEGGYRHAMHMDSGIPEEPAHYKIDSQGCVIISPISQNFIGQILEYMHKHKYDRTNPVLYEYISKFLPLQTSLDALDKFLEEQPEEAKRIAQEIISPIEEKMYTREQCKAIAVEYGYFVGVQLDPVVHIDTWFDKNYPQ